MLDRALQVENCHLLVGRQSVHVS